MELSQSFLSVMFPPSVFLSSAYRVPNAKVLCLLIPLSKERAGVVDHPGAGDAEVLHPPGTGGVGVVGPPGAEGAKVLGPHGSLRILHVFLSMLLPFFRHNHHHYGGNHGSTQADMVLENELRIPQPAQQAAGSELLY